MLLAPVPARLEEGAYAGVLSSQMRTAEREP